MKNRNLHRLLSDVQAALSYLHEDEGDDPSEDEINDPHDYLDALDDNYDDLGVEPIDANAFEKYLDKRASLYAVDKLHEGVGYIDKIDDNREDMEDTESVSARSVSGLRIPDDPVASLGIVLRLVSQARDLAKRGKLTFSRQMLNQAVGFAEAALREGVFDEMEPLAASAGRSLSNAVRQKVNQALARVGFDGNKRFRNMSQANNDAAHILNRFGLQISTVLSSDLFRYPSRVVPMDVEFINPEDPFSPESVSNSVLHFSYTKMDNGQYEVIAYMG